MPKFVNLAVIGSRGFNDYERLKIEILNLSIENDFKITCIISGGARGADSLAEKYASENGIPTKVFPADWDKYGRSAGYIRNHDIIKNCDCCVAFWDGESKGTLHSINLCRKEGKLCKIIKYDSE